MIGILSTIGNVKSADAAHLLPWWHRPTRRIREIFLDDVSARRHDALTCDGRPGGRPPVGANRSMGALATGDCTENAVRAPGSGDPGALTVVQARRPSPPSN